MTTINIPTWGQGRLGLGQGGYTSYRFQEAVGQPISISLRSGIPLETDLDVVEVATADGTSAWELRHDDTVIMTAVPAAISFTDTGPVSVETAAIARRGFYGAEEHNAPDCISCGLGDVSMRVWPGPLNDGTGRVATDWIPPSWAGDDQGLVNPGMVWMALDCICGFYVGNNPERRNALTVQFTVELLAELHVGARYVVVGHDGNWSGGWDGRKRGAGSCVFDEEGNVVAHSDSFWVSVTDDG